eukprot:1950667-Pleurochrysis_carterae.AAC.1
MSEKKAIQAYGRGWREYSLHWGGGGGSNSCLLLIGSGCLEVCGIDAVDRRKVLQVLWHVGRAKDPPHHVVARATGIVLKIMLSPGRLK